MSALHKLASSCRPHIVGLHELDEYVSDNGALLSLIASAHDKGDWDSYIFSHNKKWQFDALLGAVQNGLDGAAYWRLLTDVWVMRGPGLNADLWLNLYNRDVPPGRRAAMNVEELAVFDGLPELVTLYRGARPEQYLGLSWTLEHKVAEFFARRSRGHVYTAQLPRYGVLVYYNSRQEAEVVVDLDALPEYDIDVAPHGSRGVG